jgi:hypothetical protein
VYLACMHTLLLAADGQAQEAERRISGKILKQAEVMKPYGHLHHVANYVAEIYAQLKKPEQAVNWLEETAATGFPCYPWFEHDHALDPQWEDLKSRYGATAGSAQ